MIPDGFKPIPGSANGGFYKRQDDGREQTWYPQTDHSQRIQELKVRESYTAGNFKVVRHSRDAFVLFDSRNRERARWGTRHEIIADIHHALDWGALPLGRDVNPHPNSGHAAKDTK